MSGGFLSPRGCAQGIRRGRRGRGLQPRCGRRRVRQFPGPVGMRQDHHLANGRRVRAADLGHHPTGRQGRHLRQAQRAKHRHGVPVLRAVPQHDRLRQHRLRAQGAEGGRDSASSTGGRAPRADPAARQGQESTPTSSPGGSSNASPWPERWPFAPSSCCWTSRSRPSTPRSATSSDTRSGASSANSISPPSM